MRVLFVLGKHVLSEIPELPGVTKRNGPSPSAVVKKGSESGRPHHSHIQTHDHKHYKHTYTHPHMSYTHAYTHTYIHTCTQKHIHRDVPIDTHTHTSVHTHMFTHAQNLTNAHILIHAQTRTSTHTRVFTCIKIHTHTNTCRPRHSQFSPPKSQFSFWGGHRFQADCPHPSCSPRGPICSLKPNRGRSGFLRQRRRNPESPHIPRAAQPVASRRPNSQLAISVTFKDLAGKCSVTPHLFF